MTIINIKIRRNQLEYDDIIINAESIVRLKDEENQSGDYYACGDHQIDFRYIFVRWNGILAHYIINELTISQTYRKTLINIVQKNNVSQILVQLIKTRKQIIDYKWNERTTHMCWERLELDHALSWLSTLGGAFSALGDYFPNAAQMAGKISLHQFKLALRLGDPNVQSRCRLFMCLSLIQQGRLRIARDVIRAEYERAKNATAVDIRLVKMCLGIWAKLKYEWGRKRLAK